MAESAVVVTIFSTDGDTRRGKEQPITSKPKRVYRRAPGDKYVSVRNSGQSPIRVGATEHPGILAATATSPPMIIRCLPTRLRSSGGLSRADGRVGSLL
jgi:hypothetical protein